MIPYRVTDEQWAAQRAAQLPPRWRRKLLNRWEERRKSWNRADWRNEHESHRLANLELLDVTRSLRDVRLPLDATDADICGKAGELAQECGQLAQVFHQPETLREAMERLAKRHGVEPPAGGCKGITNSGAIARMTDPLWWRRALRKMHAKAVEGAAIRLGYVNRSRDPYVSNESLARRVQQNERNAATLEGTIARNDQGQEFTLAELAAKGSANKAIRRAELMTRISGFERIARDLGHEGLFFTITCPSRMHRWRTIKNSYGKVIGVKENKRYDGTKPNEAQRYLAGVWARIRAALARADLGIYGFRIAEPNHDGTPHWHLLVFHPAGDLERLRAVVLRYALADSPDEPGAMEHRVDFKPIDWKRGTAAGYIAKYVAKNIDGYRIEKDLLGNDALETSARVEAWASTWGIRQFQQVGGPPVGVWRELRRVEAVPEGAPDHLKEAHHAVNKITVIEGRENASVAWDRYCRAQGGVFCGRDYRIRIATKEVKGTGRYGEPIGPRPIGVETVVRELYTPKHMEWMTPPGRALRVVHWLVESTRYVWEIVGRVKRAIGEVFNGPKAPWTSVNNCTEGGSSGDQCNESDALAGAGGGVKSLGRCADAREGDGRGLRGADIRRVEGAGVGGGWVEGSADWLQGAELRKWVRQHMCGPWPVQA